HPDPPARETTPQGAHTMNVRVAKQQRRGKTRWIVDWTDHDGKRHQPQFKTKEQAEDNAEKVRSDLRKQDGRSPELPQTITWTELFERMMRDRSDLKPRTIECYRTTHTRYLKAEFGAMEVRNISRLRLREFLRSQTKSRNTVRLMHAVLHLV